LFGVHFCTLYLVVAIVMLRYRDSATGAATDCPGEWFDSHVVEGIRAFRVQSGFFRYAALAKYEGVLRRLASEDRTLSFVLGSNLTDPLTIEDVESVLAVMDGRASSQSSHLTVVALRNALYHPKIFHVVRSDRSMAAMVGSANLTVAALGTNVEAWVEVESGDAQADRVLQHVAQATDWWHSTSTPGVFRVQGAEDARTLLAEGILVDRETQRRSGAMFRSSMPAGRSARRPRWINPLGTADAPEREGEQAEASSRARRGATILRWCKKLSASDALQTASGTHPTGKLRLARAGHDIDQNTWFRRELFGTQTWVSVSRRGKDCEEAHIPFNVKVPNQRLRRQSLLVDHAPHRVAGQHNVVTVLSWGSRLGKWLREHGQAGSWITIELDDRGEYWLRIQPAAPDWAPKKGR